DRVLDRRRLDLERVAGLDPRVDSVDVDLVPHRLRAVDRGPRPGEDAPRPADGAADERRDRVALLLVGPLVDEDHALAVAVVDRPRPLDDDGEVEVVERRVAESALLDVPRPAALAPSLCRQRVEVARA